VPRKDSHEIDNGNTAFARGKVVSGMNREGKREGDEYEGQFLLFGRRRGNVSEENRRVTIKSNLFLLQF